VRRTPLPGDNVSRNWGTESVPQFLETVVTDGTFDSGSPPPSAPPCDEEKELTMATTSAQSLDPELLELSSDECRLLLAQATVGRIAFVVDGLPIILPVNYRLVSSETGLWILLRTRRGSGIDSAPEQVAFEIDGVDLDHHQGWSVLARGVLHHLDHNEIEMMRKRFDPKPWPVGERSSWLAVKPATITGRRLTSAEREWAFPPDAYL
jgi:nitroimidazol reductase NimA-like FMN-containing flavoprotein (pyridoxamine 5'-phosphate oxidase superfamily)